jgi:hypothetical protein
LSHKICPICSTPAHRRAVVCSVCGASLRSVKTIDNDSEAPSVAPEYDHQYGETDLSEGNLNWKTGTYILGGMLTLAILACIGVVFALGIRFFDAMSAPIRLTETALAPQNNVEDFAFVTSTPQATLYLPTVTPAPPTGSPTPTIGPTETPGPCMQEVLPNDSLIVIVQRCGHRDLAVIDLVLQLNNLERADLIQAGQMLEIPWPTPTPDPNAQAEPTEEAENGASADGVSRADGSVAVAVDLSATRVDPTATLQPGVQWHQVALGEDIISIASRYGADIKIMSELNPQVTFSQCDFGKFGGGEQCIVTIFEGQFLRVPAPTPLPTLSPTPSGSETPTPTPTATFNAPSALSPDNRMLFRSAEFVTLRWVASGSLAPEQMYRVYVEDLTTGTVYSGDTIDLSFIIPQEWQGRDSRRHEYAWSVSVIDLNNPDQPFFTTETRTFTWEARG